MPYLSQHKDTENLLAAFVQKHSVYRPIVEFLDKIVQQKNALTWLELEEIAVLISEKNCSGFCSGIHKSMRERLQNQPNTANQGRLDALLEFAQKLNDSPDSISQQDIKYLQNQGLNDDSIEDVVAWVAIINFYNISANGLGFQGRLSQQEFDEMGEGTVEFGGFLPIFDHFSQQAA